jgi:pimeloyl-ACP methyl ester carboxylesterase
MRPTFPACLALLALSILGPRPAAAGPDSLAGHWEGAYSRMGSIQLVSIDLALRDSRLVGTYDVPECDVASEVIRDLNVTGAALSMRPRYGLFQMVLSADRTEMTGQNGAWKPPVLLHLKRRPLPARPTFPSDTLRFRNGGASLAGTLVRPVGPGPFPAVVVVHGSGASGRTDAYYHFWGNYLAARGIAVLLYDKRGVGASSGDFESATFDDLAGDALAGVAALRTRPAVDPRRIGLLGISQGGWIAPLAASRSTAVSFLILDVGPAVSVGEQELDRVRNEMLDDGASPAEIGEAVGYTQRALDAAYTGKGRDTLDSLTAVVRARPWATHVQLVESEHDLEDWRRERYDPAAVLSHTKLPVLALLGERDPLVSPADNRERFERYLGQAGNRDLTIAVIPGAGHDLVTFGSLRGGEWKWPESFWVWPRRPAEFRTVVDGWLQAHRLGVPPRGTP